MRILVKVDDEQPVIVQTNSEFETILLYSNWCQIYCVDLDEINDKDDVR